MELARGGEKKVLKRMRVLNLIEETRSLMPKTSVFFF